MAMLGLRSLYFVLSDVITRLRYLRHGLALLLAFTGTKMLAGDRVHIGPGTSVLVIGLVLLVTIAASVVAGPPATHDSRTASI
jgi:tellurite resistance protein TerC